MKQRISLPIADPKAYQAMLGLEKYLSESDLDHKLVELIKNRVSQINGCAYCINMHTADAIQLGESPQRLFLLNAWRETELFSPKEKAVLALAEEMTLIAGRGVSDQVYEDASNHLTESELSAVIMAIVTINAWNRIAITSQTPLS